MFELDMLVRLSKNLRRGGHSERSISKDMGAEAGALISVLGPERLPRNWQKRVGKDKKDLLDFMNDKSNEAWLRHAVEAHLAMSDVLAELDKLLAEQEAESPK